MSMTDDSTTIETMADLHHTHIGRDAEGDWHHHDTESNRIHVVSDDGSRETHSVSKKDRDEWVVFVDDVRGWDDLGLNVTSAKGIWGDL